jgi:hypothetical protein
MFQDKPAWIAHQRKRWLRPDWRRYMRPDWHRWLTPETAPWLPPEAWPAKKQQPDERADEIDVAGHRRAIVELRSELAKIEFELKFRRLIRKAGFNPDQPRVPAGSPDGGQWTGEGGSGGSAAQSIGDATSDGSGSADQGDGEPTGERRIQMAGELPDLRRIHPYSTYQSDPKAKDALDFCRQKPTGEIVESLKPGNNNKEPLTVKPDGTVMQGNTRVKVLEERGYNTNSLPREPLETPSLEVGRPEGVEAVRQGAGVASVVGVVFHRGYCRRCTSNITPRVNGGGRQWIKLLCRRGFGHCPSWKKLCSWWISCMNLQSFSEA